MFWGSKFQTYRSSPRARLAHLDLSPFLSFLQPENLDLEDSEVYLEVSQNGGTPKSSIFMAFSMGFSITDHPAIKGYPHGKLHVFRQRLHPISISPRGSDQANSNCKARTLLGKPHTLGRKHRSSCWVGPSSWDMATLR